MPFDTDTPRFTPADIQHWRTDGAILLDRFFTPDEVAPIHAEMTALYGRGASEAANAGHAVSTGGIGAFNLRQFTHIDNMPFAGAPQLTLLALHPALIALARAALGTPEVYLYQSHSWAKFTGETDFEQPFHCDYKNHTLLVPDDDLSGQTINCMIYLSDVALEDGAIAYVPQPQSNPVTGENRPMFLEAQPEAQAALKAIEHRAPGPAGSIFAYGTDVYHRGMNLTRPGGYRYTLTASFKAAGNDRIGYTAWPYHFLQPWHLIFDTAGPDQLACLGVPRPGHAFWTPRTLARAQDRYPGWNLQPYRDALATPAKPGV